MAVACTTCSAVLPDGAKFCIECGTPVLTSCPSCGTPAAGGRFCAECGSPLIAPAPAPAPAQTATPLSEVSTPVAERRLTTVLFADLVGFTPLSEARDPEEVRELLSSYFARAREVIGVYGGTVEKFIGDAVMAVWGVPVTHEDDAERAVRAGLDLASMVAAIGLEVGAADLRLRVGLVTGEVAVTLGATGEGMVAGDAVNTAARVQAAAAPGQVWVDEATRSLTAAAVAYSDTGTHQLKGKAEPTRLFHAERVLGNRGGAGRVDGLDAGFVGRDREIRLVKEIFHAAGEFRQGRLVAVTGEAGIGKSRLAWEFEKYIDGITENVLWHHGRALAYGDGVAMGALAEMVRSRLGVADGDEPDTVTGKLDGSLAELVPSVEERSWVRARIAVLLGLPGAPADLPRLDLFTAWRVFLERVGHGEGTVVLIVEDAQYADDGLLDFLEFLVETAGFPVFVMTLARPELAEQRPQWGTGRKSMTLYLEPLDDHSMGALLDELVSGLPGSARNALTASSEGLPLYALETVRSLIDRDVVVPHEGRYVLSPGSEALVDFAASEAPTSLRALIASRLDALPGPERRCLQDAAVLGQSFTPTGVTALSGLPDDEVTVVLESLLRRQLLTVETDPRSPERGSYKFSSALVRTVAYDTLARRDRKSRHLAAAAHLRTEGGTDAERAAVIAAHYLAAHDNAPGDPDAQQATEQALAMLKHAGDRASALSSHTEALRYYEKALGLASEPPLVAELSLAAAQAANVQARYAVAAKHAERAREHYVALERPSEAGAALAAAAAAWGSSGSWGRVVDEVTPALNELRDRPDSAPAVLLLYAILARAHAGLGQQDKASEAARDRLRLAEAVGDAAELADALLRHGAALGGDSMPVASRAMTEAALDLARRERIVGGEMTPLNNLAAHYASRDIAAARRYAREGWDLAESLGDHDQGNYLLANLFAALALDGSWDELLELHRAHTSGSTARLGLDEMRDALREMVLLARGDTTLAPPEEIAGDDVHVQAWWHLRRALQAEAAGDVATWAANAVAATEAEHAANFVDDDFPLVWPHGMAAAMATEDEVLIRRIFAMVDDAPPGLVPTYLRVQHLRFTALLALQGIADADVDATFSAATEGMAAFGAPFWTGRILLEHAEWLEQQQRADEAAALLSRAELLFRDLSAEPWLARCRREEQPALV